MTAQDVDAVFHLAAVAKEAPQWSREAYRNILGTGTVRHFAWLAADQQNLHGFAIASWLPPEEAAELETVVVDERFRRQGIARRLLRACMLAAADAGATSIRLEVRESNSAALALYQQNSFAFLGRRPGYYSAPAEDAILLQAHLGSSAFPL